MEKSSGGGGGGYRPSRGKLIMVHCGHCEGKPAILLQGLKRHTERVHGKGVAPLLKGEKQVGDSITHFCREFSFVAITRFLGGTIGQNLVGGGTQTF